MRVLQVGKFYPPDAGGVETGTRQMVETLARLGHENAVLCFAGAGPYDDGAGSVPVLRAATWATVASQPLSTEYLLRLADLAPRVDVLHVHWPNPLAAMALWFTRPRTAIVLHWHSDVIGKGALKTLVSPFEAWLCRRAELVIGPTEVHLQASGRAALFAGKGAAVPFFVEPDAADPGRLDPAALAAVRERTGGRRLVFALGRLVPYKGFAVLVEAARRLPDDAVAVIGGAGPLAGELARQIETAGLGHKVLLAGRIPDAELPAWFACCDVFCLPSVTRAEMFGIVQLEAMAWGKPVVATAIAGSGVAAVNRHGETGLVVPPGDASALGAALATLLADAALAARLGQGGRQAAAARFSPRAVAEALGAAYARLDRSASRTL
jgi:rhamnosyl/mannosyltransferase